MTDPATERLKSLVKEWEFEAGKKRRDAEVLLKEADVVRLKAIQLDLAIHKLAKKFALAAASGTAETGETPAQCEASQSGDAKQRNAQGDAQ